MISYNIIPGATDVSVVVRIIDSTDGTPETGVVFNTAGIDMWYRRELAASVDITEVTLAALTTAHADGGFLHINDGYYRLDLPDAAVAAGSSGVLIGGAVTGMVVIGCYIQLTNIPADTRAYLGTTVPTPTVAGVQEVDVTHWLGTAAATPTIAGVPEVDVTHLGGAAQSATDLKDFADDGYDPATNKVQGVVLTDTLTTYTGNTPQTGDAFARLGAPAGASVSADIAAIEAQTDDIGVAGAGLTALATQASVNALPTAAATADAVWDEDATGHQTTGTFGQAIGDPVADTNTIYKSVVTDATGATVGVDVVALKAETAAILTDTAEIGAAGAGLTTLATQASVNTIDDFLDTEVAAILAAVDTEIAAIKAKADLIPGTIDGKTFSELVTLIAAVLLGKASGLDTTTAVYRSVDDIKARVTATVDSSGNRSAVTLDAV